MIFHLRNNRLVLCLLLFCVTRGAIAEPLLWRVDNKETGGQAYLFGSVHFGTKALYPLPDIVEKAYSNSLELVVELDMAAIAPHVAAQTMRQQGRYIDGDSLYQHLDDQTLDQLADACLKLGLPVGPLENLKPWLVAVQLTAAQVRRAGFSDHLGIDRHFIERVKKGAPGPKKLIELETFEQQLSIFTAFSDDQQLNFLQQTLTHFEHGPEQLRQILNAWQTGDAQGLDNIIRQGFDLSESSERFFEVIYGRRNQSMSESIQRMLDDGRQLFVVVGVGHLVGEGGLAARLTRRGQPVKLISKENYRKRNVTKAE
jgi:uncharacterized protein YbaP (TraB family)